MDVRWAEMDAVLQAAEKWSNAQRECRAMNRHFWTSTGGLTLKYRRPDGGMVVRQTCGRGCGCARLADMNREGYVVSSWRPDYSEAPEYLLEKLGRIDKQTRDELVHDLFAGVPVLDVED